MTSQPAVASHTTHWRQLNNHLGAHHRHAVRVVASARRGGERLSVGGVRCKTEVKTTAATSLPSFPSGWWSVTGDRQLGGVTNDKPAKMAKTARSSLGRRQISSPWLPCTHQPALWPPHRRAGPLSLFILDSAAALLLSPTTACLQAQQQAWQHHHQHAPGSNNGPATHAAPALDVSLSEAWRCIHARCCCLSSWCVGPHAQLLMYVSAGVQVASAATDLLELTEENVEKVLDEVRSECGGVSLGSCVVGGNAARS